MHARAVGVSSSVSNDSCFLSTPRRFVSGLPVAAAVVPVSSATPTCVFLAAVDPPGTSGMAAAVVAVLVLRMPLIAVERPAGADVVAGFESSCSVAPQSRFHQPTAIGWLGSRVVSVLLDSGAVGPGFKSQPRRCRVTVLGKLFTPTVPLFTKLQKW